MNLRTTVVIAWLVLAASAHRLAPPADAPPERAPLAETLAVFDGTHFEGAPLAAAQDLLEAKVKPRCDDWLSGLVDDGRGGRFELQIFYCNSRRPDNRLVYYLDSIQCLHGHFPQVRENEVQIAERTQGARLRLSRPDCESTVIYWIQSPAKTSTDYFTHAFHLYARDLSGESSDGAFVKIAYYGAPEAARDAALVETAAKVHRALAEWFSRN